MDWPIGRHIWQLHGVYGFVHGVPTSQIGQDGGVSQESTRTAHETRRILWHS